MKTKSFNIEEAKAGAKLVTRNGKNARIICYDRKNTTRPIIALVDFGLREEIVHYSINGTCIEYLEHEDDLLILDESEPTYKPYETTAEVMAEIKKHGAWVKCKFNDKFNQIIGFYNDNIGGIYIELYSNLGYKASGILAEYIWVDDETPCGKLTD